jgi:hypothetical protein
LHRLTFSKSLADLIVSKETQYQLKRYEFKVGKILNKNEISKSGLYALVSLKGNITLRISLIQEIAELQRDDNSRYIAEAWILPA